jgi:hypothetical protein
MFIEAAAELLKLSYRNLAFAFQILDTCSFSNEKYSNFSVI